RVHPLFDVDGEREEVCALPRLHPSLRRCEHHRVTGANDDGAVRLLRQLSGLERNFAPADSHADLGSAFGGNCHQLSSTLLCREWGFESTPSAKSLRSSLKSPLSFFVPVPEFSLAWANILGLPAQPQFLDQCPISLQVVLLEIGEKTAAATHELEQPTPGVVVLRMRTEVFGQVVDPLREQCDLHLRRPRVFLARPVMLDDLLL